MAEKPAEFQILDSNTQFTVDLYNVLKETSPGNMIFSPISIHAVLSMAYQGALGTTAENFASTLKIPDAKIARKGYNTVMNRLNSVPNVSLLMANKIYLMEGYKLSPDFSDAVIKNFLSEVQLLNFSASEIAAATINVWVEEKTKEKIKNLVIGEDLDELTRLVLINAIYFKGNWKHKFNKKNTKTEPFYLNDIDSVNVQMMHIERELHYKSVKELEAQIIELPYTNNNLSMVIILPFKRDGIAELEKKLAGVNLTEFTNGMYTKEVTVALPRFKIEQTIDLKDSLIKLGFGEIFSSAANFNAMITSKESLCVSKVIQKVFIEVNEEGTEAAAATGSMLTKCSYCEDEYYFIANHPFILFLTEKSMGQRNILFTGKITNPQL